MSCFAPTRIWLVLVVFSFLVGLGCEGRKAQENVSTSVTVDDTKPDAFRPFDPLERDKKIPELKKPGHWHTKGQDDRGGLWEGYLTVEHAPAAYMTSGSLTGPDVRLAVVTAL